jgi:hypothetical protein
MVNLSVIESTADHKSHWLGRYSKLNDTTRTRKKTRVIRISDDLYLHFIDFSKRFFDAVSYDEILENLLKCYEEQHPDTRWYHNTDR